MVTKQVQVASDDAVRELLWDALAEVRDPEMPVVNLVELGIIREIAITDNSTRITITPTFAACPAYEVMTEQIIEKASAAGASKVEVSVRHDPPWTSDWISAAAREKLRKIGITPPGHHHGNISEILLEPVECPHCGSENTSLQNSFGTTACRMIYTCRNCKEPFEFFKPL
jgi:ring-1,2-phenylacetyl-CoA epoxidase subunit PaaD